MAFINDESLSIAAEIIFIVDESPFCADEKASILAENPFCTDGKAFNFPESPFFFHQKASIGDEGLVILPERIFSVAERNFSVGYYHFL